MAEKLEYMLAIELLSVYEVQQFVDPPASAAELRFAEQRPQQDNPPPGDRQGGQAGQQDGLHRMDFGEAAQRL